MSEIFSFFRRAIVLGGRSNYERSKLCLLNLRTNVHFVKISSQVIFIHREIVSGKYVAIRSRINAVKIDTVLSCISVGNYLFVPSDMLRLEAH